MLELAEASVCGLELTQVFRLALTFLPIFSDFEAIVKLSDGFNGADLRNVCTEAGQN